MRDVLEKIRQLPRDSADQPEMWRLALSRGDKVDVVDALRQEMGLLRFKIGDLREKAQEEARVGGLEDQLENVRAEIAERSGCDQALVEARDQMLKLPSTNRFDLVPDPFTELVTEGLRPMRFGDVEKILDADPRGLPDVAEGDTIEQRLVRLVVMAQSHATRDDDVKEGRYLVDLNIELSAVSKTTGINYTFQMPSDGRTVDLPTNGKVFVWSDEIRAELRRSERLYLMRRAGRLVREGAANQAHRCMDQAELRAEQERDAIVSAAELRHILRRGREGYALAVAKTRTTALFGQRRRASRGVKTVSRQAARRAQSRSAGGGPKAESSPGDPEPSGEGRPRPPRRLHLCRQPKAVA